MSKKVNAEMDKCKRELDVLVEQYDFKWRELKSYNEATANPMWATLGNGVVRSSGFKAGGKKSNGGSSVVVTVDISEMDEKQLTEIKRELRDALETLLGKLYRCRKMIKDWIKYADFRSVTHSRDEMLTYQKTIESRYRHGKDFFMDGMSSEDTTNEQADKFNEAVNWMTNYQKKFREKADIHQGEIATATKPLSSSREALLRRSVQLQQLHADKLDELLRGLGNNSVTVIEEPRYDEFGEFIDDDYDRNNAEDDDESHVEKSGDVNGVNGLLRAFDLLREQLSTYIEDETGGDESLAKLVSIDVYDEIGFVISGINVDDAPAKSADIVPARSRHGSAEESTSFDTTSTESQNRISERSSANVTCDSLSPGIMSPRTPIQVSQQSVNDSSTAATFSAVLQSAGINVNQADPSRVSGNAIKSQLVPQQHQVPSVLAQQGLPPQISNPLPLQHKQQNASDISGSLRGLNLPPDDCRPPGIFPLDIPTIPLSVPHLTERRSVGPDNTIVNKESLPPVQIHTRTVSRGSWKWQPAVPCWAEASLLASGVYAEMDSIGLRNALARTSISEAQLATKELYVQNSIIDKYNETMGKCRGRNAFGLLVHACNLTTWQSTVDWNGNSIPEKDWGRNCEVLTLSVGDVVEVLVLAARHGWCFGRIKCVIGVSESKRGWFPLDLLPERVINSFKRPTKVQTQSPADAPLKWRQKESVYPEDLGPSAGMPTPATGLTGDSPLRTSSLDFSGLAQLQLTGRNGSAIYNMSERDLCPMTTEFSQSKMGNCRTYEMPTVRNGYS